LHCGEAIQRRAGGAGTVGLKARDLGRSFILIDIKPDYCEMSKKRITDITCTPEVVTSADLRR
jgi:DNA modification methylase